jgi:hypothetical protein
MTGKEGRRHTVDDLPRFSPWPARLLGLEAWQARTKTAAEVQREFDRDKWGALLQRYRADGPAATVETVEAWSTEGAGPELCSIGPDFELLTPLQALSRHHSVVADALCQWLPVTSLVELGAGYGATILRLAADGRLRDVRLYAAEYTRSGLDLMGQLANAAGVDLKVGHCDLDSDSISELSIPSHSILFTCMAAHYIPQLQDRFVEGLRRLEPKVVVHFEPCYEHCDPSTMTGAMRRRYIEVNDYNRNLLSLLHRHESMGSIRILEERAAVIGVNPLLPISVIAWSAAR